MITVNIAELLKDLENLNKDVVRRLEQMVRGFTYEFAMIAVEKTPFGDPDEYFDLYKKREASLGLEPIAGFAQGSWQVPVDGMLDMQETYSGSTALGAIRTHMMNYKLGEMVILGNAGPYIGALENNYSPQTNGEGIIKPTIDQMLSSYKIDLIREYQK